MQNSSHIKYILSLLFIIISIVTYSQENKFIGKYTSLGYLETSKIQMFDTDSSYIDTILYSFKSNVIFLTITEKRIIILDMSNSAIKKKDWAETFESNLRNDTLYIIENKKTTGFLIFNEEILEMKPNYNDFTQSSSFFYIKDTLNFQTKMSLKTQKKILFSNRWNLDINSTNSLELSFSDNDELIFKTASETIFSKYSWAEFANDLFILFDNNNHANYMKIIDISKDKLSIEMPVNKTLEKFDFVKIK